MKVSVLIPVYKNPKYLEDILSKLVKNILKDKEIIVIVDGELTESIKLGLLIFKRLHYSLPL